jgi:hypothetical protein
MLAEVDERNTRLAQIEEDLASLQLGRRS